MLLPALAGLLGGTTPAVDPTTGHLFVTDSRNNRIEARTAAGQNLQIRSRRAMNPAEKLSALFRLRDSTCQSKQESKKFTNHPRLAFHLREDAFVQRIEKLGHANEKRNPMRVKSIDDALWRNARQKDHSRADAQRSDSIGYKRKHVRERKHRKNTVPIRKLESLHHATNLVRQIREVVKKRNPRLALSAAVFPNPALAAYEIGQGRLSDDGAGATVHRARHDPRGHANDARGPFASARSRCFHWPTWRATPNRITSWMA